MSDSAEYLIAHLLVAGHHNDQEFWNNNWPVIKLLSSAEAMLETAIHTYKKTKTVNDALALIVLGDFAWQVIRALFREKIFQKDKKNKKLEKWIIEKIYGDKERSEGLIRVSSCDEKEKERIHKCLEDNLFWLYDLHSSIRHPNADQLRNYPFLFGEWRAEDEERLISATRSSLEIVGYVDGFFTTGYAGEKKAMATIAESNQVKK